MHLRGALLFALMIAGLTMAVSGLVQRLEPAWQPLYLPLACALIVLEAAAVQYVLRRERMQFTEASSYAVAEIGVLLVLMRVVASLSGGSDQLRADLALWLRSPLTAFDVPFVLCVVLGLLVGILARNVIRDIQLLEPGAPIEARSLDGEFQRSQARSERAAALRRIHGRFLRGGLLLLLLLALQVVNLEQIAGPPRPLLPSTASGALAYLVCGFLLSSYARYHLLVADWSADRVMVDETVFRRWGRGSLLMIGGVALAALLLPRNYGLGLVDSVGIGFQVLGWLISLLLYPLILLAFGLIAALAYLPMLLLAWLGSGPPPDFQAPVVPPPLPPESISRGDPTTIAPSIVFWICMLLLAGYAFVIVIQRNPVLRRMAARFGQGWAGRLLARLGLLWGELRDYAGKVGQALAGQLQSGATPGGGGSRWPRLRLSRLSPRDLVRYFYRSTLQRAAGRGLRRGRAQTPSEYRATFGRHFPEAHNDMAELTEAYLEAEYGRRPTTRAESERARGPWQRLKQRLRGEKG